MLVNTQTVFAFDAGFVADSTLSLSEARPNIFMVAKPRYTCNAMDFELKKGLKDRGVLVADQTLFPHVLVGDHVMFIPCYDTRETRTFILQSQIDDWNISADEIKSIALKNIAKLVPETNIQQLGSQGVGACLTYKIRCDLGYASSLILQPNLIKQLKVHGAHIVGLLDSDTMVVTGSQDLVGITLMATLMEEGQDGDKCLPPIPMLIRDRIEKWEANERNTSLENAVLEVTKTLFDRLRLKYLSNLYGDQKERLQLLNNETTVAEFIAAQDATGSVWSLCCLAEGEPALLPETTRVTLADRKGYVTTVNWKSFTTLMGEGLMRTSHYPTRYLAATFPSTSQLLVAPKL